MTDVKALLQLCLEKNLKLAVAESCTGGMVAAALTDLPGSSMIFECGFVTYSNTAKISLLGVPAATLADFGAVSEPTAQEMARGCLRASAADIAVSITGIAGPGGSEFKPEGRVCFGLATKVHAPTSETVEFGALGRKRVRKAAQLHALAMFLKATQDS